MAFGNFGQLRFNSMFGQKPDPSTANFGGFMPQKRLFSGIGPEPKSPWSQLFQTPRFDAPELGNAGPATQNSPTPTQDPRMPGMDDGSFMARLQEMSRPGPAMSAYQAGLAEQPSYGDYKPSGWRIAASAIGGAAGGLAGGPAAGMQVAENINTMPYARARQDWSDRMAGLGESAKIEADQSQNMSKAYTDYLLRAQQWQKMQQDQFNADRSFGLEQDKFNAPKFERVDTPEGWKLIDLNGRVAPIDINGMPMSMVTAIIQDYTAQTGRMNAGTNQQNALTNERNADTRAFNAQTTRGLGQQNVDLRGKELENTAFNQGRTYDLNVQQFMKPDASKMGPAYGAALRDMAQEPLYAPFIQWNAANQAFELKEANMQNPIYQNFINELRRRTGENQNQFFNPTMPFQGAYLGPKTPAGRSFGPMPGARTGAP